MANIFKERSSEIEIMDDLSYEGEVLDITLKELHTINTWLGGNHVIINGINELLKGADASKIPPIIRIADLGCGGGDLLMLIAKWARKNNISIQLLGIDANPYIIKYAEANTKNFPEIKYTTLNIFSEEFKNREFDIFTCTLFCHHFSNEELIKLFSQIKHQSSLGIVVNDIHRHWFAYHSIKWLTKLFSNSEMVKNDAKVSVLRSFLKSELQELLNKGGFRKQNITWKWAFRFQAVGWS